MKFKHCTKCGNYKFIESNGLCTSCYGNSNKYDYTYTNIEDQIKNRPLNNHFITGITGSGKTIGNILEIYEANKNTNANIYIIDCKGQYQKLTSKLNGKSISLSEYDNFNFMKIQRSTNGKSPLARRLKSVHDLIKRCYAVAGLPLDNEKENILHISIRTTYANKGIKGDSKTHGNKSPTINDLMNTLKRAQSNPRKVLNGNVCKGMSAKKLSKIIKRIRLDLKDMDNRIGITKSIAKDFNDSDIAYFDLSKITSSYISGLKMQMAINEVFQYAKSNNGDDILYIDNAQHLLQCSSSHLESLETIMRHSRRENIRISVSMQQNDRIILSDAGKSLLSNCQSMRIHRLHKPSKLLTSEFNINDKNKKYLTNADIGSKNNNSTTEVLTSDSGKKHSQDEIRIDGSFLSEIH